MSGEYLFDDTPTPPNSETYTDVNGNPVWGGRGLSTGQYEGQYIWGTDEASADRNRYIGMGEAAAGRQAYQLNYDRANAQLDAGNASLWSAYSDRSRGLDARKQQLQSADLMRDAAMGNTQSRAEILGRSMIDQGLQAQLAGAASARGGALGQAASMRQAAQGAAAYQQQGTQQLSAMRADEMDRARGQWAQNLSGIRGQDYGAAQQAIGIAGASNSMAQTAAQMAQAQGQMETNQRQLNQQGQQYYEGKAFDTRTAALNAALQSETMESGNRQFRAGMDFKRDEANSDRAMAGIGGIASGGASLATRAGGGPVTAGAPYLVGERGPELVVPSNNGVVIPAPQTAEVLSLYEPPGKQLHQTDDGHAYYIDEPTRDDGRPSLVSRSKGKAPNISQAAAKKADAQRATRPMTPDELRRAADAMERNMEATHRAQMAAGPAVRPSLGSAAAQATPAAGPATSAAQPYLMGGREDPYALMGGRENPYQ